MHSVLKDLVTALPLESVENDESIEPRMEAKKDPLPSKTTLGVYRLQDPKQINEKAKIP